MGFNREAGPAPSNSLKLFMRDWEREAAPAMLKLKWTAIRKAEAFDILPVSLHATADDYVGR